MSTQLTRMLPWCVGNPRRLRSKEGAFPARTSHSPFPLVCSSLAATAPVIEDYIELSVGTVLSNVHWLDFVTTNKNGESTQAARVLVLTVQEPR